VISKDINTGVQVANLNPQRGDARCVGYERIMKNSILLTL
jgi:hypothetical protein